MVSGSDDQSIRVWKIDQADCQAMQILGGKGAKNSHTEKVRALCFLPEISYALLSGSWDSLIKIWDIRSGACMCTISDHSSDVYGINVHPLKPFVFTSCSRDTSMRTFCIDGIIQALRLNFLA